MIIIIFFSFFLPPASAPLALLFYYYTGWLVFFFILCPFLCAVINKNMFYSIFMFESFGLALKPLNMRTLGLKNWKSEMAGKAGVVCVCVCVG